jgi:hypothetical protein
MVKIKFLLLFIGVYIPLLGNAYVLSNNKPDKKVEKNVKYSCASYSDSSNFSQENASPQPITITNLTINNNSKSWKVTEEKEHKPTNKRESKNNEETLNINNSEVHTNSVFIEAALPNIVLDEPVDVNNNKPAANLIEPNLPQSIDKYSQPKELTKKRIFKENPSVQNTSLNVTNTKERQRKLSFAEKIKIGVANKIIKVLGGKKFSFLTDYLTFSGAKSRVSDETSGIAIAALVTGIVGWVLFFIPILPIICLTLAIIFGAIGLKQTSSGGKKGRGLAIAGLVLGILGLALILLLIGLAILVILAAG